MGKTSVNVEKKTSLSFYLLENTFFSY